MTTSLRLPAALAALTCVPLGAALLLHAPSSRADLSPAPRPSPVAASAAPSVSAAASTPPVASASARAANQRPPTMADDPPGEEKSKAPTAAEWKEAARLSFDRPVTSECELRRVREWVRLTCPTAGSEVRVVAGSLEGFSASISPVDHRGQLLNGSYFAQFPVRRGDRRILEISRVVIGGYDGENISSTIDYYILSSWLPDEPPVLLLQRH